MVRGKKSGSAPDNWSTTAKWRWQAWMYLWDYIVPRNYADDTMVGINIRLDVLVLYVLLICVVKIICSYYVLFYVQESDWDAPDDSNDDDSSRCPSPKRRTSPRKSPRKSPKKSLKHKGKGKKTESQDWNSSMQLLIKSNAETNRKVRNLVENLITDHPD